MAKKINIAALILLTLLLALLMYLLYESRQRTRRLNSTLENISTGNI